MADALGALSSAIEGIPGFGVASAVFQTAAPQIITTKDPFYEEIDGKQKRRKAPANVSEMQRKLWKKVMKRAWYHDRNFCNCFPVDLGLGIIPIVTILPVIGPWICYTMHAELIKYAADAGCPKKTLAKMSGNVTLDFLISICPVLGSIFCWMHACSTKNAALFDTFMRNQGIIQEERGQEDSDVHDVFQQDLQRRMHEARGASQSANASTQVSQGQTPRYQAQDASRNPNQVPMPQPAYSQTGRPNRSYQPNSHTPPGSQSMNSYRHQDQIPQARIQNPYQTQNQSPYQSRDQSPQRTQNPYQSPNHSSQSRTKYRDQGSQPRIQNPYSQTQTRNQPPHNSYQEKQNFRPNQQSYQPPKTIEEAQARDLAMRTRQAAARPHQPVEVPRQSLEDQELQAALAISRREYEQQQRANDPTRPLQMPDPRNYS